MHHINSWISLLLLVTIINTNAQKRDSLNTYYQTGALQPLMAHYEADRGNLLRFYTIQNSPERRDRLKIFY